MEQESSIDTYIEGPAKPLTVEEFDGLVEKLASLRRTIEEKKAETAIVVEDLERLENKLLVSLEEMDRKSYKSPHGTVSISHRWRVSNPQTDEEKEALFAYLRERGIYIRYATVNNNSLNSLYMQDWEAATAKGEGMDFKMPGIGDPKLNKIISFRKA